MAARGSKQIEIRGLDDKGEMTVNYIGHYVKWEASTASANLCRENATMPPSIGTSFPDDWNVTHTANHWSNEKTMLEFADKVLITHACKSYQRSLIIASF